MRQSNKIISCILYKNMLSLNKLRRKSPLQSKIQPIGKKFEYRDERNDMVKAVEVCYN